MPIITNSMRVGTDQRIQSEEKAQEDMLSDKKVLDVCCGPKGMWFDK